jgi:hypothetical protein
MRVLDEIKKLLTAAGDQFTYNSKSDSQISRNSGEMYFTDNFEQKARQWGLSEADALDVYHHGHDRKPNMRCRTYNGYELCIYYGHNARTGQPYISTIWKRDRR